MFALTILTLYTSRVVLEQLGVVDYGIYAVVGGVVSILSFFNSSMSISTQRYMSYDIGRGATEQLKKTFNASLLIYICLAVIFLLILESLGLWYIKNKMIFPAERKHSVLVVFHLSVLTFIINLTRLPYNALILAKEKMEIYALFSLLEAGLQLGIVYLLVFANDKLILYALLMLGVSIIVQLMYQSYCRRKFSETRFIMVNDRKYLKELLTFSGWNLFGNIAAVARTQGLSIIINLFYGVMVNAAHAISIQVQNAAGTFVTNFQKALNPQIIQNYASGNHTHSLKLVYIGSRLSFFLSMLIVIPLILHTEYILELWLTKVPEYTVDFVKYTLVVVLIDTLSGPLMTLCQATGNIKWYQIIVGGIVFMNLPLSYVLLQAFDLPYVIYISMIVLSIVSLVFRLLFLRANTGLNIGDFFKHVISRALTVSLAGYLCLGFVVTSLADLPFLILVILELVLLVSAIIVFGINRAERNIIKAFVIKNVSKYSTRH